ncbi:OstA-like protein [Riemerella columbipharyngis]|uniref:OstA-like protein n=1 Tax=Riemerella columbipharyngis TaxID=1071918 RepID=A0A1G7A5T5_9FLAO|nr:OstA-like protein [Riemerella columbipharyngis]SDE10298.1 OstA-like protein [Riemerella columbipharyngis]
MVIKSKIFWLIFLIGLGIQVVAQSNKEQKRPIAKDPYFKVSEQKNSPEVNEKIRLVHSDSLSRKPDDFEGNPVFYGNVKFEHKGAVLTADKVIFYQEDNFVKAIGNVILVTADGDRLTSDEMEYDGNTEKGIAKGNVVLTDPKQTIKTETLYYDRVPNTAYFNSGGTIYNGKNTIWTQTATYFINTKVVDVTGNVRIDNDKYRLEGNNIQQNQNTNVAVFSGSTRIINKENPSNYVYTEKGRYLMTTKEVYLEKNSKIYYNGKTLAGDQLYFNQTTGFGKGEGNVTLDAPNENRYIKGGYGEIFEHQDSAMITKNPYAVKIFKTDSLYFGAQKIITYQKPDSTGSKKSFVKAYKQARIFKTNLQGRTDSISYNETEAVIHAIGKPIFWSGTKQISGDTIRTYLNKNADSVDSIRVIGHAFAISKADSLNMKDEFNQIKGKSMTAIFENGEIKRAKVLNNAQSITYVDSENNKTKTMDRIGLALSTCGEIKALFEEKHLQIVSCNIGAQTDIHPMSMVPKEKRFFPDFNWNTKDRPKKWTDIFLDTPGYPKTQYISDDSLYDKALEIKKKSEEKEMSKKPHRKHKE